MTESFHKTVNIEYGKYKFVVMDEPREVDLASLIVSLKKRNVVALVRASEPSYSSDPVIANGIRFVEMPFQDGEPPPVHIVSEWLKLLGDVFPHDSKPVCAIAVHCIAGLGRTPVLIAIALIEAGLGSYDAVALVRKKRRGAINAKQLKFLEDYVPFTRKKPSACCALQ